MVRNFNSARHPALNMPFVNTNDRRMVRVRCFFPTVSSSAFMGTNYGSDIARFNKDFKQDITVLMKVIYNMVLPSDDTTYLFKTASNTIDIIFGPQISMYKPLYIIFALGSFGGVICHTYTGGLIRQINAMILSKMNDDTRNFATVAINFLNHSINLYPCISMAVEHSNRIYIKIRKRVVFHDLKAQIARWANTLCCGMLLRVDACCRGIQSPPGARAVLESAGQPGSRKPPCGSMWTGRRSSARSPMEAASVCSIAINPRNYMVS